MQRHDQEFIRFLNTVEAQVPARNAIHAIVDNYATHKHPKVQKWLARHPRWSFHFTPTSASWLNAVEGFFAKLTRRRLKRGVFRSVADLQAAINRFVTETNSDPKPLRLDRQSRNASSPLSNEGRKRSSQSTSPYPVFQVWPASAAQPAKRVYAREGIDLDVSTLADWVGAAAATLMPLVEGSAPMSSRPSASMPTTPPCRSWPRVRPVPAGYGPMCATTGPLPALGRRQRCSSIRTIVAASIPSSIWQASPD